MTAQPDYRATLNLPQTEFPMRAELPKREPDRVRWWAEHDVYARRLARNADNPPWTLHDGPPYANGELHMGHFLGKVLKDVFVKVHLLQGRYARFRPGWDMHGLPIELETLKHLKLDFRTVDPIELRNRCRDRALHWLDVQRETSLRMGVLGDYDNPYRTLDPSFEATIVEALATLAQERQIYRGLRPTLWCIHDETALAEAEIEYHDRTSLEVYVRFPASAEQGSELLGRFTPKVTAGANERLSVLIWTTTPWSLPAVVGIAFNEKAEYGLYRVTAPDGSTELLIFATALAPAVFALEPEVRAERIATAVGAAIVGGHVRHPFLGFDVLLVEADYVALDTGTGAVTTAPGHGPDDFRTGQHFGLPTRMPVDATGHFTDEGGPYAGLQVFDANASIAEGLRGAGLLFHSGDYQHSYPHCWRCKNPVIYRATAQWFIAMDANRLRRRVLDTIDSVSWTPPWGEGRMAQMIGNHPEWCISRQRTWGTPIPAVICTACDESILDPDVARKAAARFREAGAAVWYSDDVALYLPAGFSCPNCKGTTFKKEFNIVDIWFESGVTHLAVLDHDGMPWPADLYLEGSDQYRGWFRSSLVTGVAIKGAAPYKQVVSNGWVVDENGHAMHKSAGNYIGARDAMNTYGADVLRLWVASVEYTAADLRLGKTLLENVSNVYRNLRNRLRYLLSNLYDFSLADVVPRERLEPLDKLAVAALDQLANDVIAHYHEYRLHEVYVITTAFTDDLSRFYLDPLKDALYSGQHDGKRRRSAQSAGLIILRTLAVLLAPILSFTTEEAWQFLPEQLRDGALSVFDLTLPKEHIADTAELETWELLKRVRAVVAASESIRDYALATTVRADDTAYARLHALGDGLREGLIVSACTLIHDTAVSEFTVELSPATGAVCARCRKTLPLSEDPVHPTVCAPCAALVREREPVTR